MKEQYYFECGLMLIKDGRKSRLYKVKTNSEDDTLELVAMKHLSKDYDSIDVYPQYNLIITPGAIYTLDEQAVFMYSGSDISIYPDDKSVSIVADNKRNNDVRYCVIWWNGENKYGYAFGNEILITDKYIALYIKRDCCWTVYNRKGSLVLETGRYENKDIEICGDFLIIHNLGNHTIFSLKQKHRYMLQGEEIFKQQQLILCSNRDDFAICSDLSGNIQSYYRDTYARHMPADHIEIFDFATLFCLKRSNKFFLYHFDGQPFAPEKNLHEVDFISGNEQQKTLLLGIDKTYRLIHF